MCTNMKYSNFFLTRSKYWKLYAMSTHLIMNISLLSISFNNFTFVYTCFLTHYKYLLVIYYIFWTMHENLFESTLIILIIEYGFKILWQFHILIQKKKFIFTHANLFRLILYVLNCLKYIFLCLKQFSFHF